MIPGNPVGMSECASGADITLRMLMNRAVGKSTGAIVQELSDIVAAAMKN